MTSSRRAFIDWARGLAVLLMIEAHAFDAWTRAVDRDGLAFRDATILGGFAAPLFLWLAGLSIPLAAARVSARLRDDRAAALAVCRRGVQVFLLAFLFRLQAFILSPGGPILAVFRVDVLNVMGPAIAIAALLWAVPGPLARRVSLYGALAIAIAMATPIVRTSPAVAWLPVWFQWYLRPAGEYTTFTLLPWSGFVFAGAACGLLVERFGRTTRETTVMAGIGLAGAANVALGLGTAMLPSIYAESSFWTSSPTYFAVRVGIMMLALAALFLLDTRIASAPSLASVTALRWLDPLATFGRESLFVYWIHVELVYGYASVLWKHRLPVWSTAAAYATFVVLIYQAIPLKQQVHDWWRRRREQSAESALAA